MATIRAVNEQDERLATGRTMKDGSFLQFYPKRMAFASEAVWRYTLQSQDPTIDFTSSEHVDKPDPADKRRQERLEATFKQFMKLQAPSAPAIGKEWSYKRILQYNFPAGKYYVGDLCYALPRDIYDGVFGRERYQGGLYQTENATFLVDGTAYGDGTYKDSGGRSYSVDAGIIGICTDTLIDKESPSIRGGRIFTMERPFTCRFGGGIFTFWEDGWEMFRIDTCGGEEE